VEQTILKNEWSHMEVQLTHKISDDPMEYMTHKISDDPMEYMTHKISDDPMEYMIPLSVGNPQIGIHVFKEKESMEADVRFTNPYRKRKSDDYQNDFS
jgi:hypothetical protein